MPSEFTLIRRVQFAETDMAGVMHFAEYLRWMEETEHAFFRSMGLSIMTRHDGRDIGWPRVHASCEYFAPVRFEDEVDIRLRLMSLGEKTMTYEATFHHGDRKVARGRVKAVCCEVTGHGFEAIPIPDHIRASLQA